MLVSYEWLNQYIDITDLDPETIATTLTNIGLEVEGVEHPTPIDSKVVIGKILEAAPHPNADSLQCCRVDIGEEEPIAVVCGAPNAAAGKVVAFAQVGSVLPGNFKIKANKIRGEKSHGMICSEKELGMSDDHGGIIELDSDAAIGSPVESLMPKNRFVFDISITPNRSDCLSYIGIARDLGAKLNRPLKLHVPDTRIIEQVQTVESKNSLTTTSTKVEECGRFVGMRVSGIKQSDTPQWMRRRLEAAGMRSLNLIVDITNYVLLEMGQPIHAYDAAKISGSQLTARAAKSGETLTALDGNTIELSGGEIIIADQDKAVALAGIMGGLNSEVSADTSEIIVEVAEFAPNLIRKFSKYHGMHTEASHRFERGVNAEILPAVAMRVFQLLQECTLDAEPCITGYCDYNPDPRPKKRIALRLSRLKATLGISSPTIETCTKLLSALELELLDQTDDRMLFEIPAFRHDLQREIDLIEEVARLIGYDKIPAELPKMQIGKTPEDPFLSFTDKVKTTLTAMGAE